MKAIACLLLACLAGCGASPTYRPAGSDGLGFSERRLSEQDYLIEFGLPGDQAAARRMALRRAGDLAFEAGYDWFAVTHSEAVSNAAGSRLLLKVRLGRGVAPAGKHIYHS